MNNLTFSKTKKIFFVSDLHFGAPNLKESKLREKKFLNWINFIKKNAGALFIVGDLFDFWFEYKRVVPKGFVRILGKLAALTDNGLPIYFFVGNHDLWLGDYFKSELGITVFYEPQEFNINGKLFLIGHGDGLGPGDIGYKIMKKVFVHPVSKFIYRWLHPDIGIRLAKYISLKGFNKKNQNQKSFNGLEKDMICQYVLKKQNQKSRNYYLFGHSHLPLTFPIGKSLYLNLGDWISHFSYAEFDGKNIHLKNWKK
ncbi:MAG: UDP-2,3-diacylglucosamine hydrolase [Flavobacteriaceae bacterium]|nr:UDP-2,3-diacylglucosamine hydrolase [Flavobacteriaceae bacterium]|tara:strand:+ start:32351 stop:33115 length:765 start_codon:yes stop_codon:yes gene_type:complete